MSDLLYKYRSIANLRFFKDIVINRRLYAAPFRTLNDPMEGLLYLLALRAPRQHASLELLRCRAYGRGDWSRCLGPSLASRGQA
jgi:hypothetical protein